MSAQSTDRRTMLKLGALAVAPLAALAPGVVLAADDGSAARLARLEDEQAIAALARDVVKRVNAGEALGQDPAISAVAPDQANDPHIIFATDGTSATLRRACTTRRDVAFTGQSTLEQMARFQGQAAASSVQSATLEAHMARTPQGWAVTRLTIT